MKSKRFNRVSFSKETEKAIKLTFDWGNLEFNGIWFPKSQLTFHYKKDSQCEIEIPYWLLKAKIEENNIKHEDSIPTANVLANFITKTGGDIYCND
mgnify:CR=1 FL=1|tara:strand:+ start:185 stop:472 length:288 start_codon:yes stop_codon:yes gene_type:complete